MEKRQKLAESRQRNGCAESQKKDHAQVHYKEDDELDYAAHDKKSGSGEKLSYDDNSKDAHVETGDRPEGYDHDALCHQRDLAENQKDNAERKQRPAHRLDYAGNAHLPTSHYQKQAEKDQCPQGYHKKDYPQLQIIRYYLYITPKRQMNVSGFLFSS
jgi:hypothetical protein